MRFLRKSFARSKQGVEENICMRPKVLLFTHNRGLKKNYGSERAISVGTMAAKEQSQLELFLVVIIVRFCFDEFD